MNKQKVYVVKRYSSIRDVPHYDSPVSFQCYLNDRVPGSTEGMYHSRTNAVSALLRHLDLFGMIKNCSGANFLACDFLVGPVYHYPESYKTGQQVPYSLEVQGFITYDGTVFRIEEAIIE